MHSSADGSTPQQLVAAGRIVSAARAVEPSDGPVIVLIDGRSGAGKTTLAQEVVAAWAGASPTLLSLDEIYPGWDGLDAASQRLVEMLRDARAGMPLTWTAWDWAASNPGSPQIRPVAGALVVEGAGALTQDTAALADVRVWMDAPEANRRARAFARDGDSYRPHWERWAAQEDAHLRVHRPRELADIVLESV